MRSNYLIVTLLLIGRFVISDAGSIAWAEEQESVMTFTLASSIRHAQGNSRAVLVARKEVELATERAKEARAALLPQLTLDTGYTFNGDLPKVVLDGIEGHIRFISPLVNPEDRTVRVKAEIPNPEYRLKPGMFVEVKVDLSASDKSLLLPRSAVLDIQDGQGHVFVKTGDTAKKQTVRVGRAWGENISILEGVSDTTPVLISGHRQLTDGDAVVVVE